MAQLPEIRHDLWPRPHAGASFATETMAARRKSLEPSYSKLPGIHPKTGRPTDYLIETAFLAQLAKYGPADKLAALRHVQQAVAAPSRKFEGLKRSSQRNGFALLLRPKRRYHGPQESDYHPLTGEEGLLFFVYCSAELVIHEWGWVDSFEVAPKDLLQNADGSLSASMAENEYCSVAFELELPPQNPKP